MSDYQDNSLSSEASILNLIEKNWELINSLISKQSKLIQQNEELISRNSTLEKSLGDKDSSFYELVNQKSEFELRLHTLQKKCNDLERLNSEYSEKISVIESLENERIVLKSQFDELETKYSLVSEKANFVNSLNEELELEREKNAKLHNEKLNLENKIKSFADVDRNLSLVSKELAHKNLLLNDRALEIEKLKDIIAELENQIFKNKNLEDMLNLVTENERKIKDDFNSFKVNSANEYSKLADLNTELKIKISELESQISNNIVESTYYTSQISELKNQLAILQDEISVVKSYGSDYENRIEFLNDMISDLKKNIVSKDNEILDLKNQIEKNEKFLAFNNEIAIKEIEIRALTARIDELEFSNNDYKSQLEKAEQTKKEYLELQTFYVKLENEHSTLKSDFDNIKIELTQKSELSSELQLINDTNKSELETLRNDFQALTIEISAKSNELIEYESKIIELKQIVAKLSEEIIQKDHKIFEFGASTETIQSLNNQLNIKSEKISELERDLLDFRNKNKINELNLENSRERIIDLEELLRTRYEQIDILEQQINELIVKLKSKKDNSELINRIDDYLKFIDSKLESN